MSKLKFITLMCLMFLLQACNNQNVTDINKTKYTDGIYCAKVSLYEKDKIAPINDQLNIEVKSGMVTNIIFGNSILKREDKYLPSKIYGIGTTSILTDKKNRYDIEITGTECIFINQPEVIENIKQVDKNNNCPTCGEIMLNIWNFCPNCKRIEENKNLNTRHYKRQELLTCVECGEKFEEYGDSEELCEDCLADKLKKEKSKKSTDDEEDDE